MYQHHPFPTHGLGVLISRRRKHSLEAPTGTGRSMQFPRICVGRAALGSGTALAAISFCGEVPSPVPHPGPSLISPTGNGVCCLLAVPWDFGTMVRMDLAAEMNLQKIFGCKSEKKESEMKLECSARILSLCRVPG